MNTTSTVSNGPVGSSVCWPFPSLRWSAIFGGTVAAIGIHLLMTALGVGAGLATFSPAADGDTVSDFSIGAALVWTFCALVALAFGGFVAGRFSQSYHSGFVHGILVWSITLIISILMLSLGTGMIFGGALKLLGEGIGIGAKAVATGASELAAAGTTRFTDQVESYIQEVVQTVPTNSSPRDLTRATREIGFAVTRLFAPENTANTVSNRTSVVNLLTNYGKLSEADASRTVDEWTTASQTLKTELESIKTSAEEKARVTADKAASNVSRAALWTFFGLLVGLLLTVLCAGCGARCAVKHATDSIQPTKP